VRACELEILLTHFVHTCPAPYDPPPGPTWGEHFSSAGAIDLSEMPVGFAGIVGIVPPVVRAPIVVDGHSANGTVTVTSPVLLRGP
jgi:hypothetical protein